MRNFLIVVALSAGLSGCASLIPTHPWPADLPEKSYFIQAYQAHLGGDTNRTQIENHLVWIKRFYHGTLIFPTGWNDMTRQLVDSVESAEDKQLITQRLFNLGKIISVEWAKPNNVRKINSSNMGVWGNSLRIAAERSDQFAFIDRVEQDVNALLLENLKSTEINNQRYYPSDEHDNF